MSKENYLESSPDVIIAALNEEKGIGPTLTEISQKINPNKVILVDGHSHDRTVEIAKEFNWKVYPNTMGGIPNGANEAFRHVDSDFFISVEQDVILSRNWWDSIPQYMDDPFTACAQGIRVPTRQGLRILDEWQYGSPEKRKSLVSMDNNIFRTKVIKLLSGFPSICPVCTDTVLMRKMQLETPYKWVIDPNVVSLHVRNDLETVLEHQYKLSYMCARTKYCAQLERKSIVAMTRILLTSPFRGLQVALKQRCPEIVWLYPLVRIRQLSLELSFRTQWRMHSTLK